MQFRWARHGAGHTRSFDDTVAWLAVQCSKTAVTELMRVAWRTVGSIIARVQADIGARVDRLAGLRRIGVDEISYKRGHRYLLVFVLDVFTRRIVGWQLARHLRTDLPLDALEMAAWLEDICSGLIHHSDACAVHELPLLRAARRARHHSLDRDRGGFLR